MTMAKISKITCGSRELPAGVNLFLTILGENPKNAIYGIPPHKITEAIKILREELGEDELAITLMGYGLGRERLTHTEIARETEFNPNKVSRTLAKVQEKLQKKSVRTRLEALVPTREEIYEALEISDNRKEMEAKLDKARKKINEMGLIISHLKEDNDLQRRKSFVLGEEIDRLNKEVAALRKQLQTCEAENTRYKEDFRSLKRIFGEIAEPAKKIAELQLEKIFDEKIVESLKRANVFDLRTLTKLSRRNLTNLRVRREFVDVIERGLAEVGLKLREGV